MKPLIEVVRRYQDIDPKTGRFGGIRDDQDYARDLGISPATLSRFYAGITARPWAVVRGLTRLFPQAAAELAAAMAEPSERPAPELVEVG